jgi:phenylacetate-CoA ligase
MNKLEYNYGLPKAATLGLQAWRTERGTPEQLANVQQKRFARIVEYSRKHSPFYQRLYQTQCDDLSLDQLDRLPVLTKAIVMDNFDDIVTDPALNKTIVLKFAEDPSNLGRMLNDKYFVARTSGTTGLVGHYVHDLFSYFLINVLTAARSSGLSALSFVKKRSVAPRRLRIASILSPTANLGVSSVIASSPKFVRLLSEFKLIDIFEPWDRIIQALNEFQPDIVGGFPTILEQLADSQSLGSLNIHPQTIRSGGEMLTPRLRKRIGEAFSCNVYDCYGCAECGWIGMECAERKGIHVFSDWFILEAVDADNKPVPAGVESSKILITNLANYVQPFIRFELPDLVTVEEGRCPCGSILPRVLLKGRTSEILSFPCGEGKTVVVPPFHLTTLAEMAPGIQRYQIIQENGHMSVLFTARDGADAQSVHSFLKSRFENYLHERDLSACVTLSVRETDIIQRDKSGKIRQVFSRSD